MIINPDRFGAADPTGFGNASRDFDGSTDFIDIADSEDMSFGDESIDSPFSVAAWVKLSDVTTSGILAKGSLAAREWLFGIDGADRLTITCHDDNVANKINIASNTTMTSNQNIWTHVMATYDGGGAYTGMTLYIDGSSIVATNGSTGSYTAMHNQSEGAVIGRIFTDSGNYTTGLMADIRLYDAEMSAANAASLAAGTDVTTNLVSHWLGNTDSLDDMVGTNDGTEGSGSTTTFSTDGPLDP